MQYAMTIIYFFHVLCLKGIEEDIREMKKHAKNLAARSSPIKPLISWCSSKAQYALIIFRTYLGGGQ